MASWFHVDYISGAIVTGGTGSEPMAKLQIAPDGQTLIILPDGLIGNAFADEPDFSKLKIYYSNLVDQEAGATRSDYITDVPGQAQTYEKKEAEARSWQSSLPDSQFPFMSAEAQESGLSMQAVRDSIMAAVNYLTPIAAQIEARRISAKRAIAAAENLLAIHAAATVDWPIP